MARIVLAFLLMLAAAAKSPADGYTLLLVSVSLPMTAALPVTSLKDLVALAESRPGALNAGCGRASIS